jgi:K+-transporting ATPase KdpF subunit
MSVLELIALVTAVGLLILLCWALLQPDRF